MLRFGYKTREIGPSTNREQYFEVFERVKDHPLGMAQEKHVCILHSLGTARIFVDRLNEQRDMGVVDGMRRFAWWKDGTEYVGTCGTTLKQAIEDYAKEVG